MQGGCGSCTFRLTFIFVRIVPVTSTFTDVAEESKQTDVPKVPAQSDKERGSGGDRSMYGHLVFHFFVFRSISVQNPRFRCIFVPLAQLIAFIKVTSEPLASAVRGEGGVTHLHSNCTAITQTNALLASVCLATKKPRFCEPGLYGCMQRSGVVSCRRPASSLPSWGPESRRRVRPGSRGGTHDAPLCRPG